MSGSRHTEAQIIEALKRVEREEHARLKRLAADLSLDKDALQSVIGKNHLGSECNGRKCSGSCWTIN